MMMKKLSQYGIAFILSAITGLVHAGAESGIYIGGSIGSAGLDVSTESIDFDDDDSGYKIFAGYNLGFIPIVDVAIEGSFVDFGEASSAEIAGNDVGITAWNVFGLAGFNLGPFAVFGKWGLVKWESESDVFQDQLDESGNDQAYGIGARFQIASIAVRAEYEWFDIDVADVEFVSLGASWTF